MNEIQSPVPATSPENPNRSTLDTPKLKGKPLIFAELLLSGIDQKEAYKQAGYPYLATTVDSNAHRIANTLGVSRYLDFRRAQQRAQYDHLKHRLVDEWSRISFVDVRKVFNEDGTLKQPHELDDNTAHAIASLEVVEKKVESTPGKYGPRQVGIVSSYKFWNKIDASRALGEFLGMFQPNTNIQIAIQVEHLY